MMFLTLTKNETSNCQIIFSVLHLDINFCSKWLLKTCKQLVQKNIKKITYNMTEIFQVESICVNSWFVFFLFNSFCYPLTLDVLHIFTVWLRKQMVVYYKDLYSSVIEILCIQNIWIYTLPIFLSALFNSQLSRGIRMMRHILNESDWKVLYKEIYHIKIRT